MPAAWLRTGQAILYSNYAAAHNVSAGATRKISSYKANLYTANANAPIFLAAITDVHTEPHTEPVKSSRNLCSLYRPTLARYHSAITGRDLGVTGCESFPGLQLHSTGAAPRLSPTYDDGGGERFVFVSCESTGR